MGDPAMTISQKQKADKLRALHNGPDILLFANAWDVASACILERLEFPAIATTSAGIANTLGYADGQQITSVEMLRVVSHIAHAVNIPVTADMEAGYSTSAVQMHQVALQLIEAGAVGLNLEDGEDDEARVSETQAHVEKIQAVKEAGYAVRNTSGDQRSHRCLLGDREPVSQSLRRMRAPGKSISRSRR